MVEAIFVISIFILFFLGMVYFRSMYGQKLRVMRLARAAAVGYALNGCTGGPLDSVNPDLGTASDNGQSGKGSGGGKGISGAPGSDPSVGTNGAAGSPVSGALSNQGMVGDPIAAITVQAPAGGTTKSSPWAKTIGFKANVGSSAYMSCGEVHAAGDVGGALKYAEGLFKW